MSNGRLLLLAQCALLVGACEHKKSLADYGPVERPYVQRAVDSFTGHGRISREQVFQRYDPVVVVLPTRTCVGMHLRKGIAGGDTTLCYDQTGREVLRYGQGD